MTPLLRVEHLVVDYGRGRHRTRAVEDVSFEIAQGETLGLVGESGSGKTTIAKVLVGLAQATAGTVVLDGRPLSGAGTRNRRHAASVVQMVFQDPYSSLNPARTIGSTLLESLLHHPSSRRERQLRVDAMLDRVGLPGAARHYPGHLSGGQRQRVAIARAVMLEPKLVICDEPVSALDLSVQAQILNLLAELQEELGVSYLFVAHNLSVVRHIADRVLVLYRGRVMEVGTTRQVYETPSHPYTEALLAAEPVADTARQRGRRDARVRALAVGSSPTEPAGDGCVFAARCPHVRAECRLAPPPLQAVGTGHRTSCLLHHPAVDAHSR